MSSEIGGLDGLSLVRRLRECGVRNSLVIMTGDVSDLMTLAVDSGNVKFLAILFRLGETQTLLQRGSQLSEVWS